MNLWPAYSTFVFPTERVVEQANVLERGQGRGRQGRSVNFNMQKCIWSRMKPQTRKASLSSRHRLQKHSQCNVAGSSLARDEIVSYIRR